MRSIVVMTRSAGSVEPVGLLDQLQHPIGLAGASERILVFQVSSANGGEERVQLGGVLLAPEVERNRLLQLGAVTRVPAFQVRPERATRPQVHSQLLPVDDQLPVGTVDGDG